MYDEPSETVVGFSEEAVMELFEKVKTYLLELERHNQCITRYAKTLTQFYTLCSVILLTDLPNRQTPTVAEIAVAYDAFMNGLENVHQGNTDQQTLEFYDSSRGASTDLGPRQKRYDILRQKLGV